MSHTPDLSRGDNAPDGATTPPSTMRAVTQDRYGTADVLAVTTVDRPSIAPGQVLVAVEAAGIDRGVWHLMAGQPYLVRLMGYGLRAPAQPVLGADVSGRVVAVGDAVTRFQVGDEVFGIATGAFAQYAVAEQEKLARKPANVTHDQASVAAVSGITALQALTDVGGLRAGQRVLIIGASGGVGTYATQLAVALGGVVTGVASTSKLDLVRSLGAQQVIDYTRESLDAEGVRYHLVIDIGGRNSIRHLRRVLAADGTLVIVGGEGGGRFTGGIGRQVRAVMLSPFVRQRLTMFIATEHHSFIERLATHLASGAVVPAIDRTVTLDEVPDAIRALEAGRVRGKMVVQVGGAS